MEIFQSTRSNFATIDIRPKRCHWYNRKYLLVWLFVLSFFISSVSFLLIEAKTAEEYADSLFGIATGLGPSIFFSSIIYKMPQIFELIANFESIIKKPARKIYQEANGRIEKLTKIFHFIWVKLSLIGVSVPYFSFTFFTYITTGNLNPHATFRLPFPAFYPFDWRSPGGYGFAFSLQMTSIYCVMLCVQCTFCLMFGFCWMSIAVIADIESESRTLNPHKTVGMKRKLYEMIQLHADITRLATDFSNIYDILILVYVLATILVICCTLLIVQGNIETMNAIVLIRSFIMMFWSFALMFEYCYLGQHVTDRFDLLGDAFYQCEWYAFPIEIQRTFPIILIATRKQVVLRGFGNVYCTREAFKKVVNGGFSYFMVLRQFVR